MQTTPHPTNPLVRALLTDAYQITMAYAQWKLGRHLLPARFELFFRKCPFGGQYALMGGVDEVLALLSTFRFTQSDIQYIRDSIVTDAPEAFYEWLASVDAQPMRVWAVPQGSVLFPREAAYIVEGPLAIGHLLETVLLNQFNFASLVTTNARRLVEAANSRTSVEKELFEFGLRRAQGADGGVTASRCAHIGGFHGTSNVLAGQLHNIPVRGTMAHAFVTSFSGLDDITDPTIYSKRLSSNVNLVEFVRDSRRNLGAMQTNEGELAAFTAYALAFPKSFLALVDTYDTLASGVPNFLVVARALGRCGYAAIGIRLDSGDLAHLSKESRKQFDAVQARFDAYDTIYGYRPTYCIVASNDLNEESIEALDEAGHEIDAFGIGTHLVTCQTQPAFGGVYKAVCVNGRPVIKLSEEAAKIPLPGDKLCYRLTDEHGVFLADIIMMSHEEPPAPGVPLVLRNPFKATECVQITPKKVFPLQRLVWDHGLVEQVLEDNSIEISRDRVKMQLSRLPIEHRALKNGTPYRVGVSRKVYQLLHELIEQSTSVTILS